MHTYVTDCDVYKLILTQCLFYISFAVGTFKILAANRYEAQTRYQGIRRKHDIDNCGQAEV